MSKVITTFIVKDEKPNGPRYYIINEHICRMWTVPRADLDIVKDREELTFPALYILLGVDDDSKPKAYIGQTDNFAQRVKDHDNKKDFWNLALVFIKPDQNNKLTPTDTKYLEYKAIKLAKESNSFTLYENKQTPKKPSIPEYQQAPMDDFFKDCLYLASFIGLKLFEKVNPKKEHLFYIKNKGIVSKATYNSTGLTVLKGSTISPTNAKKLSSSKIEEREKLIKAYAKNIDGKIVLTSDITFDSPSGASVFCLGSSSNGWSFWIDDEGKSLDDIYRKGK